MDWWTLESKKRAGSVSKCSAVQLLMEIAEIAEIARCNLRLLDEYGLYEDSKSSRGIGILDVLGNRGNRLTFRGPRDRISLL